MNENQSNEIENLSDEQLETVDAGAGLQVSTESNWLINIFGQKAGGKNALLFWL